MWAADAAARHVEERAASHAGEGLPREAARARRAQFEGWVSAFSMEVLPYSQLVPSVLPAIPRVSYTQMLSFFGTNFDPVRGVQPVGTAQLELISKAQGAPSNAWVPDSIRVIVDPRGRPLDPLFRDKPFPQQPAICLVDRHNRMILVGPGNLLTSVKVTAFLDSKLFPAVLDPQKPLLLEGTTAQTISTTGTGILYFADLLVSGTTTDTPIYINFSAVYVGPAGSQSETKTVYGSTRLFTVFEPPPPVIIIVPRVPMSPFLVGFLALLGVGAFMGLGLVIANGGRFFRTPAPRSDLPPVDLDARNDRLGITKKGDDAISFQPNPDSQYGGGGEEEEEVHRNYEDDGLDDEGNAVAAPSAAGFEPPPPIYNDSQLPGHGPAFNSAFDHLERQLFGIDNEEGDPAAARAAATRLERPDDPAIIEALRKSAIAEMRVREQRHELERRTLSVSLFGRELLRAPFAGRAMLLLRDATGIGAGDERRVIAQRRHLFPDETYRAAVQAIRAPSAAQMAKLNLITGGGGGGGAVAGAGAGGAATLSPFATATQIVQQSSAAQNTAHLEAAGKAAHAGAGAGKGAGAGLNTQAARTMQREARAERQREIWEAPSEPWQVTTRVVAKGARADMTVRVPAGAAGAAPAALADATRRPAPMPTALPAGVTFLSLASSAGTQVRALDAKGGPAAVAAAAGAGVDEDGVGAGAEKGEARGRPPRARSGRGGGAAWEAGKGEGERESRESLSLDDDDAASALSGLSRRSKLSQAPSQARRAAEKQAAPTPARVAMPWELPGAVQSPRSASPARSVASGATRASADSFVSRDGARSKRRVAEPA
jgi:hypothetical protein